MAKEKSKTVSISGVKHKVMKKGDKVIVDHQNKKGGKYDKIDLTKKAGAKTVSQGVKASKDYHKSNPHKDK